MAAGDVITIIEDNAARKGVVFDGTDDYVLHDAHAVERVAANDTTGTYTAWVYLDNIVGTKTILSAGDNDSATEFLQLYVYNSIPYFKLYQGGANQWVIHSTASYYLEARKWTHIAVVQNGTAPVIYVNGVLSSSGYEVSTDVTMWYDELTGCDKFAIGVKESNNTHTDDFKGAIGQVKYWSRALSAAEILQDYNEETLSNGDYPNSTYLRLNVTMNDDGITDSGAGADNGTLTGHAHYGGLISAHSMALERNCSGHAAERSTTMQISPSKLQTIIVRGD
jgi:hypothetical protein